MRRRGTPGPVVDRVLCPHVGCEFTATPRRHGDPEAEDEARDKVRAHRRKVHRDHPLRLVTPPPVWAYVGES